MKVRVLLFLLLASPSVLFSQTVARTLVQGKISVPAGEDVEGITLYNTSSQKGTVTDAEGAFELELAANDRVYITALQFQPFTVVIDEGVIAASTLTIYLNPAITQLEEVIVRPYDLTGNVRVDVKKIPTVGVGPDFDLSYEALEFGYGFKNDTQSQIRSNAAEQALNNQGIQNGGNILGLIVGLAGMLLKKKDKREPTVKMGQQDIYTALRQRFSDDYITRTFAIAPKNIGAFVYFVGDSGVDPSLFKAANELRLIDYLFQQSRLFRAQIQSE